MRPFWCCGRDRTAWARLFTSVPLAPHCRALAPATLLRHAVQHQQRKTHAAPRTTTPTPTQTSFMTDTVAAPKEVCRALRAPRWRQAAAHARPTSLSGLHP